MKNIATHTIGIILNGVTGRMGTNQHLMRSILAIIRQGGVKLGDNEVIMPEPVLIGRNAAKLERLAAEAGEDIVIVVGHAPRDPSHGGEVLMLEEQRLDIGRGWRWKGHRTRGQRGGWTAGPATPCRKSPPTV